MERTVVAITGASSGIGEEFARKLAPGHDLILIARREDRLQKLASNFQEFYGTRVQIVRADLSEEEGMTRVADLLEKEQRLSLLVNNAGFGTKGFFWNADLAGQERMHRLHVMATLRLSHAALRNMVARDLGAIVNVASVSSFVRSPGATSYSATKAWMAAFTEGLALELKAVRSNVIVQALCPGFTHSEFQQAMGVESSRPSFPSFWLTAEEVVHASIEGLKMRKLIVVPGWRYKLLTTILTRLPSRAKQLVESLGGQMKAKQLPISVKNTHHVPEPEELL